MSAIDDIINQAMRNGEFDQLPGAGKPLKIEDDSHTPEHLRMAHKMLRDHNMPPEWILESKSLDEARESIDRAIERTRSKRQAILDAAQRASEPEQAKIIAEQQWHTLKEALRTQLTAYNRRTLAYNLKVPRGVQHKALVDLERVLRTL